MADSRGANDDLIAAIVRALETDAPAPELLVRVGEPEPAKAGTDLRAAVEHPDLRPTRRDWLPEVLTSARPGYAGRCLIEVAERHRAATGRPLDLAAAPTLPRVLGCSDFLARLLLRHPHWVDELSGSPPAAPEADPIEPDWTAIRVAKYRGLLRIVARDLAGRDFAQSPGELAALADRCLGAALDCTARTTGSEAPALLALGKLGGSELNFSSDVDLLFLWEPGEGPLDPERITSLSRFIQYFKKHLEAPSEDGFAYRVDLDLRPEGRQGALINSVDAALLYYESLGADWERQMLIRLRAVAGPAETGRAFAEQVAPFVYRQLIDPASIARVRDMKLRIEAERRGAGRNLDLEIKEGPGGIRDVEFLVQAFQLFFGGRHPELRTGNVLRALARLSQLELLPAPVTASLAEAYVWLRRAEHAVQLPEERQTHRFPEDPQQQTQLARRMGYRDAVAAEARTRLLEDWTHVRAEVRGHFDALTLGASG